MTRWLLRALPLAGFCGLAWMLGQGLRHDPAEIPSPLIGRPAPAFSLPALSMAAPVASAASAPAGAGGTFVSTADWQGRPWILNVFASWCAGCRDEHALLARAAREDGLVIVGLDYEDRPDDARGWLAGAGDPYVAIARDDQGRAGIDWGVYGVPETFIVDAHGVVRLKLVGALTEARLRDQVLPLWRTLR